MITHAAVRTILGVPTAITPETLQGMVDRAVAFLQSKTHRYFGLPATVTEIVRGTGNYHLRLSERVRATPTITQVLERATPGTAPTTILAAAFSVRELENTSVLTRTDGKPWYYGYEYSVAYGRGYTEFEGPADIERAMLDLVAIDIAQTTGEAGLESETLGPYSYSLSDSATADTSSIPRRVWDVVEAWRPKVYA
jgi:hypothetical protein